MPRAEKMQLLKNNLEYVVERIDQYEVECRPVVEPETETTETTKVSTAEFITNCTDKKVLDTFAGQFDIELDQRKSLDVMKADLVAALQAKIKSDQDGGGE